ncbi:MAG: phospholipase D family protein [Clostridia bacterium]|nr:phospholipase D family protein [Clostridia bacterium]
MKRQRRRSPFGRVLRGAIRLVIAFVLFHVIAGYAPFAVLPAPGADLLVQAEQRADEMQRDITTGDRAMLLERGTDGLDARIQLIEQAREEIVIVTYECHDGRSTRDILAAAMAKADQGVRVRFLVDGIAGRLDHMGADLFRAVAAHPNVEVRFYNLISPLTPWKHMGRMHDKYVIVDDTAFILGGRNMFDKFLGDYETPVRSLDREVLVWNSDGSADSSLFALRAYFEGMWSHEETSVHLVDALSDARCQAVYDSLSDQLEGLRAKRPELFTPLALESVTVPTHGVWLIANPTTIYAKQPAAFCQLAALMRRAKRDVVLHSPYAVLNGYMRSTLSGVAAQVPLTLMVNAVNTGANVVAGSDYLYHRTGVLSTGVHLLEKYRGDSYHGKAAAIDDRISVIGSFNQDMRSAYIDTELMLVIRSPEINARLRGYLDALHGDCREITDDSAPAFPEGDAVAQVPLWKRIAMYAMGALLQPFRNLL